MQYECINWNFHLIEVDKSTSKSFDQFLFSMDCFLFILLTVCPVEMAGDVTKSPADELRLPSQ